MRALFLISDSDWSARARAFVQAARGLAAKGHEVLLACDSDCPVQVRVAEAQLPIVSLTADASVARATLLLRQKFVQHGVDVVFVHTDSEQLAASSAMRFGRAGAVIRRVAPFSVAKPGRGARVATRMAPSGLLFSTPADRDAADATGYRVPAAVAPLGVDASSYEGTRPVPREELGLPATARLIVCVHDDGDPQQVLVAMRTLSLLSSRHAELHLAVLGAVKTDDLRMHAASLGITTRVSFLGARDDELGVLRAGDVGWIAASGDAAAFAALDCMALRIPVVAARGPLTEHYIADGIAGILLGDLDPPATAATVAAFLAHDEQRTAMGNAGRARVQREFPAEPMVQGFEDAVLAAQRAAHPVG